MKELRAIRDDRNSPLLFLEGPRLVREALRSGQTIETLVLSKGEGGWEKGESNSFLEAAREKARRSALVSDSVFKSLSDVEAPQGMIAICPRPRWTWQDLLHPTSVISPRLSPIIILDGVQDPGNLAAIVRTAEAAGAAGLVTTPGTARLFSPKALRGAMGSTLRLPSLEHREAGEIRRELQGASYTLWAASMLAEGQSSVPYTAVDWKKPAAMLVGQEGGGISAEWEALIDSRLYIPMRRPVESLNVAAAAAILLYESLRQREN